jgi:hypothetical protein
MTITVTFTAESAEQIRQQMQMLLGAAAIITVPVPSKPVAAPPAIAVAEKPKRGRPPKKAPVEAPVAEPEPIEEEDEDDEDEVEEFDPEGDRLHPAPEERDPVDIEAEEQSDISALLKLKKDTIDVLQDAFAQGKVVKLRKLLMTYGDGAKSFPEVDPIRFTDIDKALKAGALNG